MSDVQEQKPTYPIEVYEAVRAELEVSLDKKYRAVYEEEVKKIGESLRKSNEVNFKKVIEEAKAKLEPPSPEQIQKVLDQEYLTFKIKLKVKGGEDSTTQEREFTIQELTQSQEKRFYRKVKEKLIPIVSEISALSLRLLEGEAEQKVMSFINSIEPLVDLMADLTAVILNPHEEDKEITAEWCQENLSSTRMMAIVNAQIDCNRMRDFFSMVSRTSSLVK